MMKNIVYSICIITLFLVNLVGYLYSKGIAPHTEVETLQLMPLETLRTPHTPSKIEMCSKAPDCKLLAEMGYFEARSETDEGVVAVMYSVINRVRDKRFPDTISEVVNQYKQYSYIWDGSLARGYANKKQLDRMLRLAYDVFLRIRKDPTNGATFYHTKTVSPYWSKKMTMVAVVDNHIFYRGY